MSRSASGQTSPPRAQAASPRAQSAPPGGQGRPPWLLVEVGADDLDLYVLYRAAGMARSPFLANWVVRHGLTSGFREEHAARHRQVLVIGPPDGLRLPPTCKMIPVQAEQADVLFAADPQPAALFRGK